MASTAAKTKAKTASPTAPQELATAKVRIDDAGEVSVDIGRLDEAAGALQAAAAALITPEAVASAEADLAKTQRENDRLKAENAALKNAAAAAAAAAADSASTSDDAPYPLTDDDPAGLFALADTMADGTRRAPAWLGRGSRSCTAQINNQSQVRFTGSWEPPPPTEMTAAQLGAIMCVAARTGMRKQMLELIDRGAPVDATGESGIPALGLAAWRGQLACVQALLERRADLHKVDARG